MHPGVGILPASLFCRGECRRHERQHEMTIQQMREKRQEMARQLRNLHEKNKGAWKPEHQAEYDRLAAEITDLDGAIAREEQVLNLAAAERSNLDRRAAAEGASTEESVAVHGRALRNYIRGGMGALSLEERAAVHNTMSTGVSTEGGATVPAGFIARLLEALKAFGGIREVATILRTAGGNAMTMPTSDATSELGEQVAENAPVTAADPTFGVKSLGAYTYSSKSVAVPMELLQDTALDLEGFIIRLLATRIARITSQRFTTGTGVGQPEGIVTASTLGRQGANGQTTTVTYDDLLRLIHSVDPAYRSSAACRFMFHDLTLLAIKLLKDSDGRPLWLPGAALKEPDTIAGYGYVICQDMPTMAANAKSILFGDLGRYTIRDVMDVTLFRMTDSAFTLKHQVGFVAFSRHDGRLLDLGGAVKHYANSAT